MYGIAGVSVSSDDLNSFTSLIVIQPVTEGERTILKQGYGKHRPTGHATADFAPDSIST